MENNPMDNKNRAEEIKKQLEDMQHSDEETRRELEKAQKLLEASLTGGAATTEPEKPKEEVQKSTGSKESWFSKWTKGRSEKNKRNSPESRKPGLQFNLDNTRNSAENAKKTAEKKAKKEKKNPSQERQAKKEKLLQEYKDIRGADWEDTENVINDIAKNDKSLSRYLLEVYRLMKEESKNNNRDYSAFDILHEAVQNLGPARGLLNSPEYAKQQSELRDAVNAAIATLPRDKGRKADYELSDEEKAREKEIVAELKLISEAERNDGFGAKSKEWAKEKWEKAKSWNKERKEKNALKQEEKGKSMPKFDTTAVAEKIKETLEKYPGLTEQEQKEKALEILLEEKTEFQKKQIENEGWLKKSLLGFEKGWKNLDKTRKGKLAKVAISAGLIGATTVSIAMGTGILPSSFWSGGVRIISRVGIATGLNMALTSENGRKLLNYFKKEEKDALKDITVGSIINLKGEDYKVTGEEIIDGVDSYKIEIADSRKDSKWHSIPKEVLKKQLESGFFKKTKDLVINTQTIKLAAMTGGAIVGFTLGGWMVAGVGVAGFTAKEVLNAVMKRKSEALEKKKGDMSLEKIPLDINNLAAHLDNFVKEYDDLTKQLRKYEWGKNIASGAITIGTGLGTMAAAQSAHAQEDAKHEEGTVNNNNVTNKEGNTTPPVKSPTPEASVTPSKSPTPDTTSTQPPIQPPVSSKVEINNFVNEGITIKSGQGGIAAIRDLQAQLKAEYTGKTAPQSVQDFIAANPTKKAIELGFYDPEGKSESALIQKGTIFKLNEKGELVFGTPDKGGDVSEWKTKYEGKMFDADQYRTASKTSDAFVEERSETETVQSVEADKPESEVVEPKVKTENQIEQPVTNKSRIKIEEEIPQTKTETPGDIKQRIESKIDESENPKINTQSSSETENPPLSKEEVLRRNPQLRENWPLFEKNEYNLNEEQVKAANTTFERIKTQSPDEWEYDKDAAAKNYVGASTKTSTVQYLDKLQETSGLKPKTATVIGVERDETVEKYTARTLQKIAKDGKLNQIDSFKPETK